VLPLVYDLLRFALELRRYTTEVFPVDWRRNLELAAQQLVRRIRSAILDGKPLHLIAHSQGALVARRALQILHDNGEEHVLVRIRTLLLLAPANFGTFSAAFAIAGSNSLLPLVNRYAVVPTAGLQPVLASMSGLYQLLPWDPERVPWLRCHPDFGTATFWRPSVDVDRLRRFFGWGAAIDTSFFNDRTHILLGDRPTASGVEYLGGSLQATEFMRGDGTVTHACSVLPGVPAHVVAGAEHSTIAMSRSAIHAAMEILAGRRPQLEEVVHGSDYHTGISPAVHLATHGPESGAKV
jgi:pimeloyl-ACP methyl ester carboxylesterase